MTSRIYRRSRFSGISRPIPSLGTRRWRMTHVLILIYWIEPLSSSSRSVIHKTETGISRTLLRKWMRYPRLRSPSAMALDWIVGNIYFIESSVNAIIVCDNISWHECALVICPSSVISTNPPILYVIRPSQSWTNVLASKKIQQGISQKAEWTALRHVRVPPKNYRIHDGTKNNSICH